MIDPELEELKKQFIISKEEAELLEIRKILDKIYVDRTIKDDRDRVAVLDLTMALTRLDWGVCLDYAPVILKIEEVVIPSD